MENEPVVNVQPTPELAPEAITPAVKAPEEVITPAPGNKTDPNLLLESLQKEREKRRQLEEELETIKSSTPSEEAFSDEGKLLEKKISQLQSELGEIRQDSAKKDLQIAHPELKDKWTEFEEFRTLPDNKGMSLRTAAKAYLVENGMFDTQRKGLEKPTGGVRTPLTSGMNAQDVENLRKNDFRKYEKLLMEGKLKIEQ